LSDPAARVLIFTHADDLHGLAVGHELRAGGATCSVIEVDRFPCQGGLVSWSTPWSLGGSLLRDTDGARVDITKFDVAWWRRFPSTMLYPDGFSNSIADQSLVSRDTQAALLGMALTDFRGHWVSNPEATRRAENKLIQLRTADQLGMRIPRTIITQDPDIAREFCESLNYEVVIKPVRGHKLAPVLTGKATPELLAQSPRVRLAPTIYQELISGSRHLRVNCFGETCHAFGLETDQLDWRVPLATNVRPVDIDTELSRLVVALVARLGLRMGVLDVKLTGDGQPVFLEVNPQGQFLFLDGLCGTNLLKSFAQYLMDEAKAP
jgi:glutathione synthase/RimK-type ligase-like ATP-grasp enzyme